jgi:hypothetical protein
VKPESLSRFVDLLGALSDGGVLGPGLSCVLEPWLEWLDLLIRLEDLLSVSHWSDDRHLSCLGSVGDLYGLDGPGDLVGAGERYLFLLESDGEFDRRLLGEAGDLDLLFLEVVLGAGE